jgi:hypothetical protein
MRRFLALLTSLKSALPTAGAWLLFASHARADAAGQEGSWPFVGSYAVVVLLVTLGLLVVCQGGRRADEPPLQSRFED